MSETREDGAPCAASASAAPASGRPRTFDRSPAELKDVIAAERVGHPFLIWRDSAGHQRILPLGPATWRVTS
ncbi:MAG: hypothetical protein ACXVVK_20410, partial [Solirubrobacteraceae bacterium]